MIVKIKLLQIRIRESVTELIAMIDRNSLEVNVKIVLILPDLRLNLLYVSQMIVHLDSELILMELVKTVLTLRELRIMVKIVDVTSVPQHKS